MLRTTIFALCTLISSAPVEARSAGVELRLCRVHGLVDFVEALAGFPSRTPRLKEVFERSRFKTPRTRAAIARFAQLSPFLQRGGLFPGYPAGRPGGTTVAQIIQTQSAYSRDLDALASRTRGLMPAAAHQTLINVLATFEPIYNELIWRPNLAKLKRYRRRLLAFAKRADLDALFADAVRFYRASWPAERRFTIALFPIPGARGHTFAYSIVGVESVGVLVDEKDIASRFGVIFHELCHSLWDAQRAEVQRELEGHFRAVGGAHSELAYQTLNEALATALGNGWAYRRAAGHEDKGSWYNEPYIDAFAKALSPLVRSYLAQRKGIDAHFVKEAVARYAQRFPQAHRDWQNVLRRVALFADGQSIGVGGLRKALRRHFKANSIHSNAPLTHPASLRNLRRYRGPVVIAAGSDRVAALAAMAKHYPPVARHLAQLEAAKEGMAVGVDGKQRPFVLIVVRPEMPRLLAAFSKLKAMGQVPAQSTFVSF